MSYNFFLKKKEKSLPCGPLGCTNLQAKVDGRRAVEAEGTSASLWRHQQINSEQWSIVREAV